MQKWCICLFCEGHDDNSKNSQTNMEARYQEKDTTTLKIIFLARFPAPINSLCSLSHATMWKAINSIQLLVFSIPWDAVKILSRLMKINR